MSVVTFHSRRRGFRIERIWSPCRTTCVWRVTILPSGRVKSVSTTIGSLPVFCEISTDGA